MASSTQRGSPWSFRIGTVLGIPIRVHFTFLLVLVWYGAVSREQGDNLGLALTFVLLVFGCVVLHELGHAAMALRFGVRTRDIVLYPIGGVARLENIPGGLAELLIAIAGPAVNVALFVGLTLLFLLTPLAPAWSGQLLDANDLVTRLLVTNLLLAGFNLIPAFPMDGGRILRAALSLAIPAERATEIATTVGQAIAILFGVGGLVWRNPVLMLIALFVFVGASQEAFQSRQQTAVRGRRARDAMITRFETLAPQDSLGQAARQLIETHQQDFPVVDAWQRVVGVLPRARLLEGLADEGPGAAVLTIMDREFPFVAPDTDLEEVLRLLRAKPLCPVIVIAGGRLEGMVTLENLTEYIEVARRAEPERAGRGAGETSPTPIDPPPGGNPHG